MTDDKVGTVTHYFGRPGVAILKLEAALKVGERIVIKGAHDDVTVEVDSMEVEHEQIPEAKAGQEIGIKVPSRVHEHSVAYRLTG